MIGKKKKLTKKELQEDKLVTSFYKSQEFLEENKQRLMIIGGAIAVIILAIVWFVNKKAEDNKLAAGKLAQISTIYEQGQFQKAIDGEPGTQLDGLQTIVDNYGGTDQGEIAKIYLANAYYAIGDFEKAKEQFEDYGGNSELHQSSAYAGIAACYEANGEFGEAADYYKKAAETYKLGSQTADFLLSAGINYIRVGNQSVAKLLLEEVKKDYATSTAAREADKYLPNL